MLQIWRLHFYLLEFTYFKRSKNRSILLKTRVSLFLFHLFTRCECCRKQREKYASLLVKLSQTLQCTSCLTSSNPTTFSDLLTLLRKTMMSSSENSQDLYLETNMYIPKYPNYHLQFCLII